MYIVLYHFRQDPIGYFIPTYQRTFRNNLAVKCNLYWHMKYARDFPGISAPRHGGILEMLGLSCGGSYQRRPELSNKPPPLRSCELRWVRRFSSRFSEELPALVLSLIKRVPPGISDRIVLSEDAKPPERRTRESTGRRSATGLSTSLELYVRKTLVKVFRIFHM